MVKSRRKKRTTKSEGVTYGKGAVRYTLPREEQGPMKLLIDFAQTDPPEFSFYSNTVSLRGDHGLATVTVSFGQSSEETDKATKRVDIVMPESALFNWFLGSIKKVEPAVEVALRDLNRQPLEPVPSSKTDQVVTVYANNIYASTGGEESCLDFYYISPRSLHHARTLRADIPLEPVVRITLSVVLFKYFYDQCRLQATRSKEIATKAGEGSKHASALR